ncbi:LuxR C-terminal-related transcriptional regulator [Thiocystis violascens]|uniref:Transcriptional regulator, luxR family n=1 Tax=Thiocystis violascens (strain ATCC 17096 / DSM 198 / 6111) TaxID=765911 RepID=I3YES1_THIV6|nr:LuxR C-terminal-related transcriptional regulator [Thiocystis violascens]AFL75489.1 transcriptional regulator, luxR family [Thiocystis violascens DSM 198]
MKPTSFRLPADALERLRTLTQPGESMAAVFQRALIALEGSPPPVSLDRLAARLDALEARLLALERERLPIVPDRPPMIAGDRDASILQRFQSGETKRAIARQLGIAESTVRAVLKRRAL